MDYHFNNQVAKDYDISIATLLQNLKFWTHNNLANKKNIYDGLCWTYNSVDAFCDLFEFWTRHQIEHLFKKCVKEGLVQIGNYNGTKYDRTKWYALTPKAYQYFPELLKEHFVKSMYDSISENSEINFGDFRNQFLNFPEPIPDSNTYIKTDNDIDKGMHQMHTPVHDIDTPVHTVHTDQYSFHKSFNNSATAKKEKSNIVAIKKPKALRATAPAIDLLKLFKIRHPKKPNEKVLQLIAAAVSLLNEKGTSLEEYLSYLNDCCSNWLYLPWGTRQRTNDEIAIILKPSIINDALAGKYEDKTDVARN